MKKSPFYFLFLFAALAGGCSHSNIVNPSTNNISIGTFTGSFRRIHLSKNGVHDTVSANLMLNIQAANGYKVVGDTSTVHAGSNGVYVTAPNNGSVQFFDSTYPLTGVAKKIHLSGTYQYSFDGSNLLISAHTTVDTLSYEYNLKKTGN
jgi:hypothetical protein